MCRGGGDFFLVPVRCPAYRNLAGAEKSGETDLTLLVAIVILKRAR